MRKKLVLIALNEINFELVRNYCELFPGRFKSLEALLNKYWVITGAESEYEHLEPWIQWPSVYTGLDYNGHALFRLGDVVSSESVQIFEELEKKGFRVGVIGAMNAANRLETPAYFIPDPWTNTPTDKSWWSRALSAAISQAVNDNSVGKLTIRSMLTLTVAILFFAQMKSATRYIGLLSSSRKHPWRKALFLDLLLHDVHQKLLIRKAPDFSMLFLNAGAHIQHHYLFNSIPLRGLTSIRNPEWYIAADLDPLAEVLELYDYVIGGLLNSQVEFVIATGLSQKPYDRLKFYYRLKDHSTFLRSVGIESFRVYPRMTRDFLVEFRTVEEASAAHTILEEIILKEDGLPLFGEIDNRGKSLFISLTYPKEISADTEYFVGGQSYKLAPMVSFVAIKNGMHQAHGYAFFSAGMRSFAPKNLMHVREIANSIKKFFGVDG
jgi:hypothetical protein